MRTLNLHQLATFQVVAKHCSYVRAAEELHFSQPAVSAQIRQLEETLGVKLFDQIGRKTHLTHSGEELYLYSQKIFTLIDETLETMESLRSPHYGRLSVGADTTVGTYVIPGLLGKFHQFYSEVEITLDVVNRAALVDALVNNRIDMAIVGRVPDDIPVVIEPFALNELVLVASPVHRLAGRRSVPLEELAKEHFLLREIGSGTRAALETVLQEAGIPLQVSMQVGNNSAIKQGVAAGLGIELETKRFWFVVVSYVDGPTETYALPVKIASGSAARVVSRSAPHAIIARLAGPQETILYDAVWDEKFRSQLFEAIAQRQIMKGHVGDLVGIAGKALAADSSVAVDKSQVLGGEQRHSSMLFENKFFLKLYRKLEDGVNPDVEITRFLTERANFSNVPAFAGALEYRHEKSEPAVVCLLQSATMSESDGWALTLDAVGRYYERVLGRKADLQNQTAPPGSLLDE